MSTDPWADVEPRRLTQSMFGGWRYTYDAEQVDRARAAVEARRQQLIRDWRAKATKWEHGIGENQNSRIYRECADQIAALENP